MNKSEILAKFSSDHKSYYYVKLFEQQGFERHSCIVCKRYFWTLDANIQHCPNHTQDPYSFIGNPPSNKNLDYLKAWGEVESFFTKNNHTSINRYPVVCRWRDDLYFTIASIVNFQRILGDKISFEFPANPLIIPQPCLRFKDLENVGVTGRHFSSFCMIGQCSVSDNGYWKDECIDLDFRLVTQSLGIPKEKIVFVEDVWQGGGSFGPSLEYFVGGLELGNAVFTEFQGNLENPIQLDQKIIDMGAGLERFAWITSGTPTAYDCCFGPIVQKLADAMGVDQDNNILRDYFTQIATKLDSDILLAKKQAIKAANLSQSQVNNLIIPMENIYMICDHIRTLVFAIADGALPSNVGGGYNLRMMLRRIVGTLNKISLKFSLDDMIDIQIDYLSKMYPELDQRRSDIKKIINLEASRYYDSKSRISKMIQTLRGKTLDIDDLIQMYESYGITPEYLVETHVIPDVPSTFYNKLSQLHQSKKTKSSTQLGLKTTQPTILMFYGNDPMEYDATVLEVVDRYVVLDKTSFYARGGGQEPDRGTIAGSNVIDVIRNGNVILHKLDKNLLKAGDVVKCLVDKIYRRDISAHHTSTHILNSACRHVLGSWVWQHSAFKINTYARLDITHHSALSNEEMYNIETRVNEIIQKNIPVSISEYQRGEAEQKYGFQIYQGGVVPVAKIRIVEITGFDIEACGGTHVSTTGQIGLVKIVKTERIQDGVVRIEFVSGRHALDYIQNQDKTLDKMAQHLESNKTRVLQSFEKSLDKLETIKKQLKLLTQQTNQSRATEIITQAKRFNGIGFFSIVESELSDEYLISLGQQVIKQDDTMIYCAFIASQNVRIIIYSGQRSSIGADELIKKMTSVLNGSGGGNAQFAQGGGKDKSKIPQAIQLVNDILSEKA